MFRRIRSFLNYLAHLEWTEKKQTYCIFCDRTKFEKNIVYEDDAFVAINNRRRAGRHHWLVIPKSHEWRDVEQLESEHASLIQSMIKLGNDLLRKYCPEVSPADVHVGFHRGRRVLIGNVYWPDIVSIHHLHMHVIVEPRFWPKVFKYPSWLPLMWKSEKQVEQELMDRSRKGAKAGAPGLLTKLLIRIFGKYSKGRG